MGRKRRPKRKGRKKAGTRPEGSKGISPTMIRASLLIIAIVALVLLAFLLLYFQNAPDENGDDDNGGNGPPPTNAIPVAKASLSHFNAFTNITITFDGSRSYDKDGYVVNYTWEVHRDTLQGPLLYTYHGRKFNRTYDEPIAMFIVLIVKDDRGATNSTVKENPHGGNVLVIENRPPVAVAGDDTTAKVGKEVIFDAEGSYDEDGQVVSYHWDFGDVNASEGSFVTHAYDEPGTYIVTLTVKDDRDGMGMDTLTVVVQ